MNIESLKSLIIGLINTQMNGAKVTLENLEEQEQGNNIFETEDGNEINALEQMVGDAFTSCDKNGDGEINNEELQTISTAINTISAMTGISLNTILGIESENETVDVLTNELKELETGIPTENTTEVNTTKDEITEKENKLTELILNDELISDETKEKRIANTQALNEVSARIAELEGKEGDLTPEEVAELQRLTEEETKLKEEQKAIEEEILKNCSEETKNAINDLNKTKEAYALTESGEQVVINNETGETTIQETNTTETQPTDSDNSYNGGDNTSYTPPSTNNQDSGKQSYENMSLEKLQSELKTENTNLSEAQQKLSGILDGSNEELTGLQGTITEKENAFKELLNSVAPELAEEFDAVEKEKDNQEKLIGEKESEISKQESTINTCQRNYDNAVSAVKNQESIISELESLVSGAEGENKEIISQAIEIAKTELEKLKTARDEAEKELKNQKDKLETLKEELTQLEEGLTPILEKETAVNEKIASLNSEEINAAKTALDEANKAYETQKTTLEKAARETISSTENKITQIEAAITTQINNKAKSEYGLTNMKGTYTLNGREYNTLIDGNNLEALANKIQSGGAGNKWGHPDKCLSFAYSYGQWIDGSTNTPINGKSSEYPDAGAYTSKYGTHDEILAMVKEELDAGRPVVLQVNGNKQGNSRHYVTVVGYSSSAGDKLTESDLLILDTYDGKIEGMGDNGSRFMISGKDTGREYDYQIYVRKNK